MSLLVLSDACLAFGHVDLLSHADFSLAENERVGLIGRNGTGKSSLLKILAGLSQADSGSLQLRQGLRTAFLAQEPDLKDSATVFDQVSQGISEAVALRKEFEALNHERDHARFDELSVKLDAIGGWTWEQRVDEVLQRLGLDAQAQISELSGGNKKRVALAQALVAMPDVLLLDEPTNHLDIDSIVWLEGLLKEFRGAIVFVTHDRAFLNNVCTAIVELDRGQLKRYPGNFSAYQAQKEDDLSAQALANARADKLLAQEEVWIRKGVEARRTRSVGRIARLEKLRQARAQRRELMGNIKLAVASGERSGKIVAELIDVTKRFDNKPVIRDFSCTVLRGDKIGLIGPNGAGKTTLLKIILGELAPDGGTVKLGTKLEIAYFDQMRNALDLEASLADFISPGSEWIEINGERKHVKSYLGDFLFAPERAASPVKSLSGGERNRLLLARLFARPANVLVLDEPTNDLDVETLDLLEELLQNYSGTVFLVSHDRAFLDQVVTSVVAYEGNASWQEYVGGYEDWLRQRGPISQESINEKKSGALKKVAAPAAMQGRPVTATPAGQTSKAAKTLRLNSKEKQELAAIPDRITLLEKEQAEISALLSDPETYKADGARVAQLQARFAEIDSLNETLLIRWEELLARQEAGA